MLPQPSPPGAPVTPRCRAAATPTAERGAIRVAGGPRPAGRRRRRRPGPGPRRCPRRPPRPGVQVVVQGGPDLVEGGIAGPRGLPGRQPGPGLGHQGPVPLPLRAVVVGHHGQADGPGVLDLAQLADEDQVAQRLGHLLAVHADHGLVHPVAHEGLTGGRLGLGRLALVVGEDQVGPAPVQVDGGAQLPQGQGRALDVPARPARPPQRVPGRLVGGRGLPQHEVQGIALVGVVGVAAVEGGQAQHLVPVEAGQGAEPLRGRHVEVDGAPGGVGVVPVQDHADEAPDVGDGRGGPGLAEHGEQVQGLHVVVEAGHLGGSQVEVVDTQLAGLAQDVVVHVGDVADAAGVVAPVPQAPLEHVVGEVDGGVADVGGVVRRDAARVHGDDVAGRERHDLPPGRVVEPHGRAAAGHVAGAGAGAGGGGGMASSRPVKRTATLVL